MSTQQTYSGWTNYATWRVNLEIVDDWVSSQVDERFTDKYVDVAELSRAIEEMVHEVITEYGQLTDGFALDYALAFVSDVNYDEIALANAAELVASDEDEDENDAPADDE